MVPKSQKNEQSSSVKTPVGSLIQASIDTSIFLKSDNQGSIALAHNPVYHARMKHINIQYYYISDEVATGQINLQYIPTLEMIADGLIKAFIYAKFYIFTK